MHWCSRHLFSAWHTQRKKKWVTSTYTRLCDGAAIYSRWKLLRTGNLRILNIVLIDDKQKKIFEPWWHFSWNVQHRASWFDTQTDYAAPHLPRSSISYLCLLRLFVLPKKPSKSTSAHDSDATASSCRHRLIIHVGAGPRQLIIGSLSLAIYQRFLFLLISWWEFWIESYHFKDSVVVVWAKVSRRLEVGNINSASSTPGFSF